VSSQVKVKICGITNLDDALCAQESGADFLGFVFAKSPRRITPEAARAIISKLSDAVQIVTLFVDEDKGNVDRIISSLGRVDIIQFHGNETAQYCRQFKRVKIIKALRVRNEESIAEIKYFKDMDFILLDHYSENCYGGTGRGFDLNLALKARDFGMPIFLSGGLNPDNVKGAIKKVNPFCVDVSSGVEIKPGKKDHYLVKRFIENARNV
jgi:phosphoribosylanthranilate isomerase